MSATARLQLSQLCMLLDSFADPVLQVIVIFLHLPAVVSHRLFQLSVFLRLLSIFEVDPDRLLRHPQLVLVMVMLL